MRYTKIGNDETLLIKLLPSGMWRSMLLAFWKNLLIGTAAVCQMFAVTCQSQRRHNIEDRSKKEADWLCLNWKSELKRKLEI